MIRKRKMKRIVYRATFKYSEMMVATSPVTLTTRGRSPPGANRIPEAGAIGGMRKAIRTRRVTKMVAAARALRNAVEF